MTVPRGVAVLFVVILAAGCASGPVSPAPTASAGSSRPIASAAASPSLEASPSTSAPKPGEAWVVLRWPVIGNEDGIWLSRLDGSDRHQLVPDLPGGQASPAWSPDGEQIVFAQRTPAEALWIVDVDGTDPREIVPVTEGCCGQDHPNWSPDGSSISFMRWLGPESAITSQVMVYDVRAKTLRVAATIEAPLGVDHPRWSPDGRTIAVEVARLLPDGSDVEGGAIGLISVDSGAMEVITSYDLFAGSPQWRADGSALVFDSYGLSYGPESNGRATNLYTVNVDGSDLRQLTRNEPGDHRATQPVWLDDDTIAYVDAEATASQRLFVRYMTADGAPLPDPTIPIEGAYPRFRPGT